MIGDVDPIPTGSTDNTIDPDTTVGQVGDSTEPDTSQPEVRPEVNPTPTELAPMQEKGTEPPSRQGGTNDFSQSEYKWNTFNIGLSEKESDPTMPLTEKTLNTSQVFDLSDQTTSIKEALERNHVVAVNCPSEQMNKEIMVRLATHDHFRTIPSLSTRQCIIDDLISSDSPITLKSLINKVSSRTIAAGKPCIVFVFESLHSFSTPDRQPIFLASMRAQESLVESLKHELRNQQVYLVYFFHSDQDVRSKNHSRRHWHWPDIQQPPAVSLYLRYYLNDPHKTKELHNTLRIQQSEGIWPSADYDLIHEIKELIETDELEDKIRHYQEVLAKRSELTVQGKLNQHEANEKNLKTLRKNFLKRAILFVGTFFDHIGINEFRSIVSTLIGTLETERTHIDKTLRKQQHNWLYESDRIISECGIVAKEEDNRVSMRFSDKHDREAYLPILKRHFPQFVQEQGERLLNEGFFFQPMASAGFIQGMNGLLIRLMKAGPESSVRSHLLLLAQQLDEKYVPIAQNRAQVSEMHQLIRFIREQGSSIQYDQFEVVMSALQEGSIDHRDLIRQINEIGQQEEIDHENGHDSSVSNVELIEELVKNKERLQHTNTLELETWRKQLSRYVRLIFDLNNDPAFSNEVERFLEQWQTTGRYQNVLLEVLMQLYSDYDHPTLPVLQKNLLSKQRQHQIDTCEKFLECALKSPINFREIHDQLNDWTDENESRRTPIGSMFARSFLIHYLEKLEYAHTEFKVTRHVPTNSSIQPDQYGTWPSTYPFFAQLTTNTPNTAASEWKVLIEQLFSKRSEEAYVKLQQRIDPSLIGESEIISDYMFYRIAGFIENWSRIITGDSERTSTNASWKAWEWMIAGIVDTVTTKQSIKLLHVWRINSDHCLRQLSRIRRSNESASFKRKNEDGINKRRDRLRLLHTDFRNKMKEKGGGSKNTSIRKPLRFDD